MKIKKKKKKEKETKSQCHRKVLDNRNSVTPLATLFNGPTKSV